MAQTPEQRRAYRREYYLRNRETFLERQREYAAANPRDPAKRREYYLRNREGFREKQRAYDAANPRDPEGRREYNRHWQARARAATPEKYRAQRMYAHHGMWPGDWAAMWAAQDGRCYLCGDELTEDTAVIEHDHRCCPAFYSCRNCRRGLACEHCNRAIGLAQDDPDRLRRMADALEAARLLVDQRLAEAGEPQTLF